jgi:hypothetical protein
MQIIQQDSDDWQLGHCEDEGGGNNVLDVINFTAKIRRSGERPGRSEINISFSMELFLVFFQRP